jgi:hypothetical protein
MKTRWFVALVLAYLCSVAAAATKSNNAKAQPNPTKLSATHGYVLASIPQWEFASEFRLEAASKKQKPARAKLAERVGTRSWAGWVPAGEYIVAGQPDVPAFGFDGKPYANVTVRAGEITDLGILLRVPVGSYEYRLVPLEDAAIATETAQALSRFGSILKTNEVIRWRPEELPRPGKFLEHEGSMNIVEAIMLDHERKKQRAAAVVSLKRTKRKDEFLPLAKEMTPPTSDEAAADTRGNLYYGADLGQIRVRDATGNWSHRDTGTYIEVTAVEYGAGHLVAGNLRGQVLRSTDDGATWAVAHEFDSKEAILDIDHVGGRWIVIAAPFEDVAAPYYLPIEGPPGEPKGWMIRPVIRVYGAANSDLSDFALMREFLPPAQRPFFTHRRGEADAVGGFPLNGDYLVHTPVSVYRLHLTDGQWSTLGSPGHFTDIVRASADGKFLTAADISGLRSKLSYSTDGGTTWQQHSPAPSSLTDVVMTNVREGTATKLTMGRFTRTFHFFEFDAKQQGWRFAAEAPKECVRMLRDAAFEQRYCVTRNAAIADSANRTWKVEFMAY